jgi:hypothetical protein
MLNYLAHKKNKTNRNCSEPHPCQVLYFDKNVYNKTKFDALSLMYSFISIKPPFHYIADSKPFEKCDDEGNCKFGGYDIAVSASPTVTGGGKAPASLAFSVT